MGASTIAEIIAASVIGKIVNPVGHPENKADKLEFHNVILRRNHARVGVVLSHDLPANKHGHAQVEHGEIVQIAVTVLVTEAFGPPIVVVSVPVAVMLFVAVEVSEPSGVNDPLNEMASPFVSVNGSGSGSPSGSNRDAVRSSTTFTFVSVMSPQFVT